MMEMLFASETGIIIFRFMSQGLTFWLFPPPQSRHTPLNCRPIGHNDQLNGYCAVRQNNFERAYQWFIENLTIARRTDNDQNIFFALLNVSGSLNQVDNYEEALVYIEEMLQIAERNDNDLWRADALFSMGIALDKQGENPNHACETLQTAREMFRTCGIDSKVREVEDYIDEATCEEKNKNA